MRLAIGRSILVAKDIVGGYSDLDILKGASVDVHEGEVVCIIGPNGAGKSTLLKAVVGLVKIRSGSVHVDGKEITGRPPTELVGAGVGYVPQLANVFPNLTVRENLDMGAFLRKEGIEEARRRVFELFPILKDREGDRVGRMSGGQRQMVAIGRALMMDPRVLLLDEPSAGLAPNLQDEVFERVVAIAGTGTAVLLVEQNAKKALAKSDRGFVLDQGKNRFTGTGRELLEDENVGRLYLGGEAPAGADGGT